MKNWMTYFQTFKKSSHKNYIYVIDGYKRAIKDHTGLSLIAGGMFLKTGAAFNSFLIVAPGYVILVSVIGVTIKSWRDKK